jgi:hypothetical protein
MVDRRYTIFAQVKIAAEAIDFELWRSRRKTSTAGSSTTWQATKPTTGASSSSNHKTGRYPVPVNTMKNSREDKREAPEENYAPRRPLCCTKVTSRVASAVL